MMTTREIAELTGKEHNTVCRDVRDMFATLNLTVQNCTVKYTNDRGRQYDMYVLDRDLTMTLARFPEQHHQSGPRQCR